MAEGDVEDGLEEGSDDMTSVVPVGNIDDVEAMKFRTDRGTRGLGGEINIEKSDQSWEGERTKGVSSRRSR